MGNLLNLSEIKDDLNIDHNDQDTHLNNLIDEAEADLQAYLNTPITSTTYTERFDGGSERFILDRTPIDENSVTVTDKETKGDATDDETEDTEDYRIYPEKGIIRASSDNGARRRWASGLRRFEVEYDAGLENYTDWTNFHKLRLKNSIRQLVSYRYEYDAGVTSESYGGGFSKTLSGKPLPPDVQRVWDYYAEP